MSQCDLCWEMLERCACGNIVKRAFKRAIEKRDAEIVAKLRKMWEDAIDSEEKDSRGMGVAYMSVADMIERSNGGEL